MPTRSMVFSTMQYSWEGDDGSESRLQPETTGGRQFLYWISTPRALCDFVLAQRGKRGTWDVFTRFDLLATQRTARIYSASGGSGHAITPILGPREQL